LECIGIVTFSSILKSARRQALCFACVLSLSVLTFHAESKRGCRSAECRLMLYGMGLLKRCGGMTFLFPFPSHSNRIIPIPIPVHSLSNTAFPFPLSPSPLFPFPPIPIPISGSNYVDYLKAEKYVYCVSNSNENVKLQQKHC